MRENCKKLVKIIFIIIFGAILFELLWSEVKPRIIPTDPNGRPVAVVFDNNGIPAIFTPDGQFRVVVSTPIIARLDYYKDKKYVSEQGKIIKSAEIRYYGEGTNLSLKCYGKRASFTGNWANGIIDLFDRETYDETFTIPVSSPTILVLDLAEDTTVYWRIGGLKDK